MAARVGRFVEHEAFAALVFLFVGCSRNSTLPSYDSRSTDSPFLGPVAAGETCSTPGTRVECGNLVTQSPDTIVCAMGQRTCIKSTWGSCVESGQRFVKNRSQKNLTTVGSTKKCSWNVCDPACQQIDDDPQSIGLPADAGYTVDGGVSLKLVQVGKSTSSACTGLKVTPNPFSLTVSNFSPLTTNPTQITFTAQLQPPSCYPNKTPVLWSIDRTDIATIDANGTLSLVTPIATPLVITAHSGTFVASAFGTVNVAVADNHLAPTGTIAAFTGAPTATDSVALLYPYARTVFPLGLPAPLLQWAPGVSGAASAVKVSLRHSPASGASFNWSAIVPENSSLVLDPNNTSNALAPGPRMTVDTVDEQAWRLFERSALGQEAAIVIQRITGTSPTVLYSELSTPIQFASNQLKGTVYYHSYGTNLVKNFGNTYPNGNTSASTLAPPPPLATTSAPTQSVGANQLFGAATLKIKPGDKTPTVAAGYSTNDTTGKGCRVCHNASSTADVPVLLTNLYPNSSGNSAIFRLGVDAPNAGLPFPGTPNNGKFAWGAVYPDGTKMFSNSGPSNSFRSASPPGGLEGSDNGTNGNVLYSLNPATLGAALSMNGMPPPGSTGFRAALPAFSTDGKKIAFNFYAGSSACKDSTGADYTGDKHSLAVIDYTITTSTFSNCRVLVKETSACNSNYPSSGPCTDVWPAFLPTTSGDYAVVFEREVVNNGSIAGHNSSDFGGTRGACDYYPGGGSSLCGNRNAVNDGTKAELWLATTNPASPALVRLSNANGTTSTGAVTIPTGSNNHTNTVEPVLNYEPTTAPQLIGGYYWVAFTSRRLYGNVATVNPWWSDPRFTPIGGQYGPTTKKIWVTAVDADAVSKATGGTDPSHPPFYLPGQELLAGNAKAYWSIPACIAPSTTKSTSTICDSNLDCCGATNSPATSICALDSPLSNPPVRHCIPLSVSSCIADNSTTQCVVDAQCCNNVASGSICVNNVCQPPPPVYVYQADEFYRDYEAICSDSAQLPIWREIQWKGTIPSGTSVDFFVQTAETEAELDNAPAKLLVITATSADLLGWSSSTKAVDQILRDPGLAPKAFIRLTIRLNPSSDGQLTPVITDWRQLFDCKDAV